MFKTGSYQLSKLNLAASEAERNYKIQVNDYLEVQLYANHGEKAIDFNISRSQTTQSGSTTTSSQKFLVQQNGLINLPMIGDVYVKNFTLHQTDSLLSKEFEKYYEFPYVTTHFVNKRVVVLGTVSQVVPLMNEKMTVLEVLATTGSVTNNSKVRNIRLIRGDLNKDPQVFLINLSTIEGMKQSQLLVEPNDIIYVEPVKRIIPETFVDIYPLISILTTILTIIAITR